MASMKNQIISEQDMIIYIYINIDIDIISIYIYSRYMIVNI